MWPQQLKMWKGTAGAMGTVVGNIVPQAVSVVLLLAVEVPVDHVDHVDQLDHVDHMRTFVRTPNDIIENSEGGAGEYERR